MVSLYSFLFFVLVCNAQEHPGIKDAFASVQRDGKSYKTFYNNYIAPHAILERNYVFTAHQDGNGHPIIDVYDIGKKNWIGSVLALDFGLGADTHGNPSICIDGEGHLHIFFGFHGAGMKHIRSVAPYNIHSWEEMPSPTPHATYSQSICMADGCLYLFYPAGGHKAPWSLRISNYNGKKWSTQESIIEMRQAFVSDVDYRTVHCFLVYKDDDPRDNKRKYQGLHEAVYRYNIYYTRRTIKGQWIAHRME
jgi:hypothetical protein